MPDQTDRVTFIRFLLEKKSCFMCALGLFLMIISSFLLAVFPMNIILTIFWLLSIIFTIIAVIFLIESQLTNNFWGTAYWGIIIFSLLEGVIILEHLITFTDVQTILNTYITIEIAILSVVFAAVAIKDNILRGSSIETIQFKEFVFLLGFFLLGTLIFYCLSFVNSGEFPFSSITIGPFCIYIFDLFFFGISLLINIIIMTMVFYIAKIIGLNITNSS